MTDSMRTFIGRQGHSLPWEKEEPWKIAIMEKEAAKRKREMAKATGKICATCGHMGYRQGKYVEEGYCTLTGKRCGLRGKENCLGWRAKE